MKSLRGRGEVEVQVELHSAISTVRQSRIEIAAATGLDGRAHFCGYRGEAASGAYLKLALCHCFNSLQSFLQFVHVPLQTWKSAL
ncbi:unnamed protein product [Linum tenue]|uniref:Uncharacterized protein n=1 Tax=Linum tenue TaxID=586396 RepID=A0AAV0GU44_9ROSI|nr:unnamed protein product [Linum tenue]